MKVLVAGDFASQNRVAQLVDKGNFSDIFGGIAPLLENVDYSVVNFEAPVIKGKPTPIEKVGPSLSCSERAMEAVRWAGFGCVTLANNHFRDQGEQGVIDTIDACEKFGVDYVGGGKNLDEASQTLVKEINGEKLAIVNVCEHEWSIATEEHGGSNPLNPIAQYYAIQEARKKADYVLVIIHGGMEGCQYPTLRMQETYRFLVDAGADAVVNHHQHCYSGYEVYHGKPIFYGLGNFCFDIPEKKNVKWNEGYLVSLCFEDHAVGFELIPYKQCNGSPGIDLMEMDDLEMFEQIVSKFNDVMCDKKHLNAEVESFVKSSLSIYALSLEPYHSEFMRKAYLKGWLPTVFTEKNRMRLLGQIECESHQERLKYYLRNGR